MDNKIATFIFFMLLLYTVSAARLALDPPLTNPSAVSTDDASKLTKKTHPATGESVASTGSNILLPVENVKSDSNETTTKNYNPEPEKKSTNDLTPRTNFSRFRPINRHFLSKPLLEPKQIGTPRRPCRKHAQYRTSRHRTGISDRKQEITAGRTDRPLPESFRGEVPSNWLKLKHHYNSRGQQNNRRNKNNEDGRKTKNVFDREKLKSLIRQHNDKKRDEEAGRLNMNMNKNMNSNLMKSIRKFLKHTFD